MALDRITATSLPVSDMANKTFMDIPDNDLRMLSYAKTAEENSEKQKKFEKIGKTLMVGIPVADTFLTAANSGGNIASKAKTGARTGIFWATAIAGITLANKVYDKACDKIPFLNKFRENSPALSSFANILFSLSAASLANKGANALISKAAGSEALKNADILGKVKSVAEKVTSKIPVGVKKFFSKENKIVAAVSAFALKNPKLVAVAKKVSQIAVPAAIVGYIVASVVNHAKQKKQAEATYESFKDMKNTMAASHAHLTDVQNNLDEILTNAIEK